MRVIVYSKTMKVTKAIRDFCQKQCAKLLRGGARVARITVFLDIISRKKSDRTAASAKIHLSLPGKDLVIRRSAHDLYEAIVDTSNRAARYLREHKQRRVKRRRVSDLGIDLLQFS